jgi:putative ABC transport system permease protein
MRVNIRAGLRALIRTPAFTLTVVLTLAVGLAAATAMFSIVHGVLLAPLPFKQPDRLFALGWDSPRQPGLGQPLELRSIYLAASPQIEAIGFYRDGRGESNVWDENSREPAQGRRASWLGPGLLEMLGVPPLLGRHFTEDEYRMGDRGAVLLSEAEWRSRYRADPDVIGRTLMVNSVRRQIIGVMPAHFAFPNEHTRLWMPARLSADGSIADFSYRGVARLGHGAEPAQLEQVLAARLPELARAHPRLQTGGSTGDWLQAMRPRPALAPLHETLTGSASQTLWLLAAAAVLVLAVTWANAANLLLIRADTRRAEQALRQALGARGWQALSQRLVEPALLTALAALLAVPLSALGIRLFVALGPTGIPRLSELSLGLPGIGVMLLLTALSALLGVLCGQLRAPAPALASAARQDAAGARGGRAQASMVVAQFAVALAVTAGALLLLRSADALRGVNRGFETARVTTLWTQLPFARYGEARAIEFYSALSARVRDLPGVEAAGLATRLPLAASEPLQMLLRTEAGDSALTLPYSVVGDGYFRTLRIPVLAGREFLRNAQERTDALVLSEAAARALLGTSDAVSAIGRRVRQAPTGPDYTVVGVVGDVRDRRLSLPPAATVYRPPQVARDAQREPLAPRSLALLVRLKDDGANEPVIRAVRDIVFDLDPSVSVSAAETLDDVSAGSTARLTLSLQLLAAAAVLTILMGNLGLYGALAYRVALQRRELGIRAALGAAPARIARQVATRGIRLALVGCVLGLGLYLLLAPALRGLLFGVESLDPASLLFAALLVLATALLASILPALRAARVAPLEALSS